MILLTKSKLDPYLYKVALLDAPGNGSTTSMYQNIIESSSTLNPFEVVFDLIKPRFNAFGYSIFDEKDFEDKIKPLYQILRHGLAFDWVLNYVVSKIYSVFPYCHFKEFSGTQSFVNDYKTDTIFNEEIAYIDAEFNSILDHLFLDLDKTVFNRLVNDSGTNNFSKCVEWARDNGTTDDYFITEQLVYNMNYLVALGLMLELCVGNVKRNAWHETFTNIKNGTLKDEVIICGGKFRAFAYGNIRDEGIKWHRFDTGIQYDLLSSRSQKKDYIRVFPDEMTFFRFNIKSIMIDESYFPTVSFDDGVTWFTSLQFNDAVLEMDKPLKLRIKYKFKQDPNVVRTIKLKAKANCAVKDYTLTLDQNGFAETQIIFRGDSIGFKISEDKKEYPFAVFNNSKLKIKDLNWL